MGIKVDSIWFNYEGSSAIDLVDPNSDESLGKSAEWTSQGRNKPAAYVRGNTAIDLTVSFSGFSGEQKVRVMAGSTELGQKTVIADTSELFAVGSLSLKDAIAVNRVTLTWEAWLDDGKGAGEWLHFDSMQVTIYTTWAAMVPDPSQGLSASVYYQLVEWTCTWASGLDDTKDICDAVIMNLALCGLKYGPSAWTVRDMLLNGGGMCQGWVAMYQYMVYCHGIFVYRRGFMTDWRALANDEVQWAAIVSTGAGLNQKAPPVSSLTFQDDDTAFPIVGTVALKKVTAPRWIFWGSPSRELDGHAVNFLTLGNKLYLYDPSFGTGPFDIDMALPPADHTIQGGTQLTSFKKVYLNDAMTYMMGSLINGGKLYKAAEDPLSTGITVKTALIPDVVSGFDEITFYWVQA